MSSRAATSSGLSPLRAAVTQRIGRGVQKAAPTVKWSSLAAGAGVVAGSLAAGAVSGLAGVFARTVVTPVKTPAEDLEILAVVDGETGQEIILPATEETTVPGTYSLVFDGGASVARIGAVTSFDPRDGTVQRQVEQVYSGDITRAVRGRWTGFVYPDPRAAGYETEDVKIPVENGSAPAWLVRPEPLKDGSRRRPGEGAWAVMVHGRGTKRTEGIRAVSTARSLGMTSLMISYRNDGDAPAAPDGRYGLGTTEWQDVEAAVAYALDQGATEVVLFGWSMGGAVCLQLVDRSELAATAVAAMVLDGPVINWIDVLAHQAKANRLPEASGRLGQWLMSNKAGRWATGLAAPVDLKAMNWVARAEQLRVPTLILHSEDDDFVPLGPSVELAAKAPQLVSFVRFRQARHTREWNVDPEKWHLPVSIWLSAVLTSPRPGVPQLTS
ncbi:alpha/beta hydrolase family protein [Micrococcus terreus]|uniref:alpha/beta hydrolase family protein n=1 Tax=Micrococcus terreus TaxID=574650 RepID=UPI00254D4B0A|nr:alpha/beta fold hydrolase [Micrococcus terreus]MDK7700230.1 alpha/beta fold hydrolase [Micrococcus terreus]WOO98446.1 alpha/beta fold hydrolase [Micrococcus terreus]